MNDRIKDILESALIDSMSTQGWMTDIEYQKWKTECREALAWLDAQPSSVETIVFNDEQKAEVNKLVEQYRAIVEPPAQPPTPPDLRERLAEYSHTAWSKWMRYFLEKTYVSTTIKETVIPRWAIERWTRQMNTEFSALPTEEKQSDYDEADAILAIVQHPQEPKP